MSVETELVIELSQVLGSERKALAMTGVAASTWYYRKNPRPGVQDPLHQSDRAYESRVSTVDRDRIAVLIKRAWEQGESVDWAYATALDEGVMLASQRTWWRIAAELEQQLRPKRPRKGKKRIPREVPRLVATGPNQVWTWDIERHEAFLNLAVVKGHRFMPVAAGV